MIIRGERGCGGGVERLGGVLILGRRTSGGRGCGETERNIDIWGKDGGSVDRLR